MFYDQRHEAHTFDGQTRSPSENDCQVDLITSEIAPDTAPVLGLGAGTGVFTQALLARGEMGLQ